MPDDRPTAKQQRYLRALAQQTGTSFTPPATRAQASREIDRLKKLGTSPRHERSQDRRTVSQAARGDAATPRADEIVGYGSSATWGAGKVTRGHGGGR